MSYAITRSPFMGGNHGQPIEEVKEIEGREGEEDPCFLLEGNAAAKKLLQYRVHSVKIWVNKFIYGIQFIYQKRSNNDLEEGHQYLCSTEEEIPCEVFELGEQEYINGMACRAGWVMDQISFTTNQGRSVTFGGDGGDPFNVDVPKGREIRAVGANLSDRLTNFCLFFCPGPEKRTSAFSIYPEIVHMSHVGDSEGNEEIDAACNEIHEACEGFGTDEDKLCEVIGSKTATQRYLISLRFPELHGKELRDVLGSECSGKFKTLLQFLAQPIEVAEAQMIYDAVHGIGTSEKHLIPILCGRSNDDMIVLKRAFFKKFEKDLTLKLDDELGGDLKTFIIYCLNAIEEEFDPDVHTEEKAEADAKAFYDAGEGKWGTDEEALFKIICTTPPKHLANMDVIYAREHGNTLKKAIKKELGGKTEDAVMFAVGMAIDPYATIAELFESTMKGLGTDELGLSMCMVRYHHVLSQVQEAYEKKYERTLEDRIHGETSGSYRDLLIAMLKQ